MDLGDVMDMSHEAKVELREMMDGKNIGLLDDFHIKYFILLPDLPNHLLEKLESNQFSFLSLISN